MSEQTNKKYSIGAIVSTDLTVPGADALKDFYAEVIGWIPEELNMGGNPGYVDYVMKDAAGNWAGGICHARGVNADIPPQWIVYIQVADVKESVENCSKLGGKTIKEAFDNEGNYLYAMLQDPAGAIIAVTHA